jgi:HSP20 family molecular chaperone IbpA
VFAARKRPSATSKTRIRTGTSWNAVIARFSRGIPLPFDPDPAKAEAKFDKGVLHVHLPKPAEVAQKQQKIEIKKG